MTFKSKDEPYDFVTYAIQCSVIDTRPDISTKYLAPCSKPSDTKPFDTIERSCIAPTEGQSGADKWLITDQEGDQSYPLYLELAAEADEVYYVGKTEDPEGRINHHFRPSDETKFFQLTEQPELDDLEEVRYHTIQLSQNELIAALEDEMSWELRYVDHDETDIRTVFERVLSDMSQEPNPSIMDIRSWQRNIRSRLGYLSVKTFEKEFKKFSETKVTKEREMANDYIEIDSEEEQIDQGDIRTYAYWM